MINIVGGIFQDTTNFVPMAVKRVYAGVGGTEKRKIYSEKLLKLFKG